MKDDPKRSMPPLPDARAGKVLPFRDVAERLLNTAAYSGIPTVFRGVQMRSRLEARWASFFEQCGWPWIYEPLDLPGWIPDFQVGQSLVEVKPFSEECQWAEMKAEIHHAFAKAGMSRDVFLLGIGPEPRVLDDYHFPKLGLLLDYTFQEEVAEHYLEFGFLECDPSRYTAGTTTGIWKDRIYGIGGKGGRCDGFRHEVEQVMETFWASAGNATQWKAPKA